MQFVFDNWPDESKQRALIRAAAAELRREKENDDKIKIAKEIAEKYDISLYDLINDRSHRIGEMRLEAMCRYRSEMSISYTEIGKLFSMSRQNVQRRVCDVIG